MAALSIDEMRAVFSKLVSKIKAIKLYIPVMGLIIISISCQEPPMGALQTARGALKHAADAGALRYAEGHYRSAEKLLKSGWMEMAHQKGRLAPFRNYHAADSILSLATNRAMEATRVTQEMIQSLDSLARGDRDNLAQEIKTWREALDGSLENFRAEHYWSAADMALSTGKTLIAKGEFEAARETLKKGMLSVKRLEDIVAEYANEEAQKISVWRSWVDGTIRDSREKGRPALIVDKSAHKAYLVNGGRLVRTYDCELGYNSARQKLFAGDGATPEGTYYVSKVKYNSKFHRALLIDYPNSVDLRRFRENKSKGIISRYARIGALIEIHGEGGKDKDWTDGCVALSNRDIEHLLQFASVGTPVTIVRKSDRWP